MKKKVLLGITSGIAAYKILELISTLKQNNVTVSVIMTQNARNIVSPQEVEKISGNKVYSELFGEDFDYKKILERRTVDHIALADSADLMVIAPATANSIAKLAHGIADDFLTTTALAMTKPIIICPSMNVNMWNNPIVQENVTKLKNRGMIIIPPATGSLACGYEGAGRLEEIPVIKKEILEQLEQSTSLKGKKIIVTAGGTTEKIDDVRSITNRSSGKMGVAIAETCYQRGAEVLLIRAKNAITPRYLIPEQIFTSSEDLFDLIKTYALEYDYIYHAAAVSDFVVKETEGKISSERPMTLQLIPQKKIIHQIKKINPHINLIAFKAEYDLPEEKLIQKAREKLITTGADAIVANDVSKSDRGFESDMNAVIIVCRNGETKKLPHTTKKEIATKIVDYIFARL